MRDSLLRSVRRMVAMAGGIIVAGVVVLVQLLGAVRAVEFMAFAGDTAKSNGENEQGEKFHRAAS